KEKRRKQKIKDRLTKRYGHKPSDSDLEWRILNDQLIELERKGDWGFARNKRLEMAKHIKKYSKPNIALKMFCEVCYIDSNGPRNTSGLPDNRQPFTQSNANIFPGIIRHIKELTEEENLDIDQLKKLYLKAATETNDRLGGLLPIKPK